MTEMNRTEDPIAAPDVEALQRELDEARSSLAEREATITQLEQRMRIDELLRDAEAIDLEAARLLTEAAVAAMDEPDIDAAVAELRSRKPRLFANTSRPRPFAQGAGEDEPDDAAMHAAAEAHATGNRRDLLRYLRLRREKRA